MRVILFGASGMVGQGVLRECLLDPGVETVLVIGRSSIDQRHDKLREMIVEDVSDLDAVSGELEGYDAAFFCLGVSAAGLSEEAYRKITYDITLDAALTLAEVNPQMVFTYVSGAGTDSSERGGVMWARVKGATENALMRLPFKAVYLFRPGIIRPLHGIRSKTKVYRVGYALIGFALPLVQRLFPKAITDTEQMGRAMLRVAREGFPKPVLESRDIIEAGKNT